MEIIGLVLRISLRARAFVPMAIAVVAFLLLAHSSAEARKVFLHCSYQAPGSKTLTDLFELDLDRSTVKPEAFPLLRAQIGNRWISWTYPNPAVRAQVDQFTGEFHKYMDGEESRGRGDLDLSHWQGHCDVFDGPKIR
jgi:hypothetical protein